MNEKATFLIWYDIWRNFVKSAQLCPDNSHMAKQACTAQAKYVMHLAIEKAKHV